MTQALIMREKFPTKTVYLRTDVQRKTLHAIVDSLPLDAEKPLECIFREEQKRRRLDQNAAMWAGPLRDIAEQAYIQGRTYSAEIWHEHFKEQFLPEDFDAELCKEGYRKWDFTPAGKRVLIGSTTQLTIKGFALYLQQVEAFGANLGVQFSANPNLQGRSA